VGCIDGGLPLSRCPHRIEEVRLDMVLSQRASARSTPPDPNYRDEDDGRVLRLDEIEAQYFLTAVEDPALDGHLSSARVDARIYLVLCLHGRSMHCRVLLSANLSG
jgi:hypothetical protein